MPVSYTHLDVYKRQAFGSVALYLKQIGMVGIRLPTGFNDGLSAAVQVDRAGFTCLPLLDRQLVTRHIVKCQAEQVTDSQSCIDTETPNVRVQGAASGILDQLAGDNLSI